MNLDFVIGIAMISFSYGFLVGKLNDKKFWKWFHQSSWEM